MKPFAILLALLGTLSAGLITGDSDFDGVDDRADACPGTPFEQIVSADGCAVEERTTLIGMVGLGATYATGTYGGSETITSVSNELIAALYAGNFYVSVLGAYYYRGAYDPAVGSYGGSGVADTLISAAYTLHPLDNLTLTPGVHFKLATADSGIGTGENDYGASLMADVAAAPFDFFALGGYTVTGDSAAVTYQNPLFGSVGAGLRANQRTYLSLSYDYSQPYDTAVADLQALSLYGMYNLNETLSLRLNYSYGLSTSAAQHSASVMLTTRF